MNKLIDLQEQTDVQMQLLITSVTKGITNNGANYLNISMQDNTKVLESKLWDVSDKQIEMIKPGQIYLINFDILNYRGALQGKIYDVKPLNQDTLDLKQFVKESEIPVDELQIQIKSYINMIENKTIKSLIVEMFNIYHKNFFEYPAATKNHHNYLGGLANHTLSMLKLANAISGVYPMLSTDLLYGGILLHDMGKIEELSGPFLAEYTTLGKLVGHISIVHAKLCEVATKLGVHDSEETMLLRHIVLSHHGKLEFGSPILPLTIEAEVIQFIDNIDARVEAVSKAFNEIDDNEFTPRIFSLENRSFYKHTK